MTLLSRARMRLELQAHLGFVLQNASDVVPGSLVDAAHLMGLTRDDAERIAALHLLVADIAATFADGLPPALRALPRSTVTTAETGSTVRAGIDWAATIGARSQAGWDRTTYVTSPPLRHFDLPETRVLRSAVLAVGALLRLSAPSLGIQAPFRWRDRIRAIEFAHELARRNWVLMSASPLGSQTDRIVAQAAQSRSDYVRNVVVPLVRLNRSLFEPLASRSEIGAFLSQTLFDVVDDWHMFELTILFRLARRFARGAKAFQIGLLEPGRGDRFARFVMNNFDIVEMRFQRRPSVPRTADPMFRVLGHYDLPVQGPGMPDIVIELRGRRHDKRVVIETKYSAEPRYLAEGLYQLDGYLRSVSGDRVRTCGLLVGEWYAFEGPAPVLSNLSASTGRLAVEKVVGMLWDHN